MTDDDERKLIDRFLAREILTGVDGGLRRAVEAMRADFKRDEIADWERIRAAESALEAERERSAKLREALKDAVEALGLALDDMHHYFENKCLPIEEEINAVRSAKNNAQKAIAEYEANK